MATITIIREPNMRQVMETVWVALGVDPKSGKEGIISEYRIGVGMMPMVEVVEERVDQLVIAAQKVAAKTGGEVRVVRYTTREAIKTFPAKP